jgi:hypothetical protein
MIVAPPGCGKTELVKPMKDLPNVHLIDSITPNTFISGKVPDPKKPRGKDGLLERIGNNATILFPEFSTVLEGNRDKRDEIFAQLRRLYDGDLRREFGVEGLKNDWAGRLTVGAAVTPAVDRYASVFKALGDRFVMIRWPRVGGVDAALRAMDQDHDAKNVAMRSAVHYLFTVVQDAPLPDMDTKTKRAFAALGEIIAVGRTHVERDRADQRSILYDPDPEGNTRLAQQLAQVAKGSARLEGRDSVNDTDIAIAHRVAFDTLLPARAAVLRAIASGQRPNEGESSRSTAWRALRDLEDLGMVTGNAELGKFLADAYAFLWMAAGLSKRA